MDKKGFTLVEMLVVLAITALLSTIAIIYSHIGQSTLSLSIEESKVAQFILEARELSIATYSTSDTTCAYGVEFNYVSSTYSLFEYNSAIPDGGGRPVCPSLASTTAAFNTNDVVKYTDGTWQVHTAPGVTLINGGNASNTIQAVLFYPPDPFTLISLDGTTFLDPPPTSYVYLKTSDGGSSRTLSVNSAGEVNL